MPKFSDSSYKILKDYFDVIKTERTDDDNSYILGQKRTIVSEGGIYTKLYQENEAGDFIGHRFIIQDIAGNNFRFEYVGLESSHSGTTELAVGERMWFRKDSFFHDWLLNNPNASVAFEDFINTNKAFIYFGEILQISNSTNYNIEFRGLKDWTMAALPEHNRTDNLTDFMEVYWDRVYHQIYNLTKTLWSMIDPKEVKIDHLDYLATRMNIDTDKDKIGGLILREWVDQLIYWLKRKGGYTSWIAVYKMILGGTRNKLNIFEKWCEWCLLELRKSENWILDRDFDEHHVLEYYSPSAGLPSGGAGSEYYGQYQIADYPVHADTAPVTSGCLATRYICGDLNDLDTWATTIDEQGITELSDYSVLVDNYDASNIGDVAVYGSATVTGAGSQEVRNCFRVMMDGISSPSGGIMVWAASDTEAEELSSGERGANRNWVGLSYELPGADPVFKLMQQVPSASFISTSTFEYLTDETYYIVVEKKNDILTANFYDNPSHKSTEILEQLSLNLKGDAVGKDSWNTIYTVANRRSASVMQASSFYGEVSFLRQSAGEVQTLGTTGTKVITPHIRVELDLSTEPMGTDYIISQDQAEELVRYWEYLKPVSKFVEYNWLISPVGKIDDNSEAIKLYNVDNTAFCDTQFVGQNLVSAGVPSSGSLGPTNDWYENTYKENRLISSDEWSIFHGLGSSELIIQTYDKDDFQVWPINHIFLNENRVNIEWAGNKRGKALIAGLKPWNHSHFQSEPASAWNITHNQGLSGANGVAFEIISVSGTQGVDLDNMTVQDTHFDLGPLESWTRYFGPSAWTVSGGWVYDENNDIYEIQTTAGEQDWAVLEPSGGWNTDFRRERVRITFTNSSGVAPSATWWLNGDMINSQNWNIIAQSETPADSNRIVYTSDFTDWWYDSPSDISNLRFKLLPTSVNTSGASGADYYFSEIGQNTGFGINSYKGFFDNILETNNFISPISGSDGNSNTYSYIPTGSPASGSYATDGNTLSTTTSGSINSVEIRIRKEGQPADAIFRPVFNSTQFGDSIDISDVDGWSNWFDITNDSEAAESWLWSDVYSLGSAVHSLDVTAGTTFKLYDTEIRVEEDTSDYLLDNSDSTAASAVSADSWMVVSGAVVSAGELPVNVTKVYIRAHGGYQGLSPSLVSGGERPTGFGGGSQYQGEFVPDKYKRPNSPRPNGGGPNPERDLANVRLTDFSLTPIFSKGSSGSTIHLPDYWDHTTDGYRNCWSRNLSLYDWGFGTLVNGFNSLDQDARHQWDRGAGVAYLFSDATIKQGEKVYFEIYIIEKSSGYNVGIGNEWFIPGEPNPNGYKYGANVGTFNTSAWGFGAGQKWNGSGTAYGGTWNDFDTLRFCVDMTGPKGQGKIWMTINDVAWPGGGDPENGTGFAYENVNSINELWFLVSGTQVGDRVRTRFAQGEWTRSAPTGFNEIGGLQSNNTPAKQYTPWIRIDNDPNAPEVWTQDDIDALAIGINFRHNPSDYKNDKAVIDTINIKVETETLSRDVQTEDYQLRNIEFWDNTISAGRVSFESMPRKAESYVSLGQRGIQPEFEFWFDYEITAAGIGIDNKGGEVALLTVADAEIDDIRDLSRLPSGAYAISMRAASLSAGMYMLLSDFNDSGDENTTEWNIGETAYGTSNSTDQLYIKFNRYTSYGESSQPAIVARYYSNGDRLPEDLLYTQAHYLAWDGSLIANDYTYILNAPGEIPSASPGLVPSGTFIYSFDEYDDRTHGVEHTQFADEWETNPGNMVDGSLESYGQELASNAWQILSVNPLTASGSIDPQTEISNVKIRAHGLAGGPPRSWDLQPVFTNTPTSATYYYDTYRAGFDSNSANAVDGSEGTFATANGATQDQQEIVFISHTASGATPLTGEITKVEVRFLGSFGTDGTDNLYFEVFFDGTQVGNSQFGLQAGRWTDAEDTWSEWINLADEVPGPGWDQSPSSRGIGWTWQDFLDLDLKITYDGSTGDPDNDFARVAKAEVRVQMGGEYYRLRDSNIPLSDQVIAASGGTSNHLVRGIKPGKPNIGQGSGVRNGYWSAFDGDGNLWIQSRTSDYLNHVNTQQKDVTTGIVYKCRGRSSWIDKIYEPSGAAGGTGSDFGGKHGGDGSSAAIWWVAGLFYNENTGRMGHSMQNSVVDDIRILEFSETSVDYPNQMTYEKDLTLPGSWPNNAVKGLTYDPINDNYIMNYNSVLYVLDGTTGAIIRQRAVRQPAAYQGFWGLDVSGGVLFQQADNFNNTPWIYAIDPLDLTSSTTVQPSAVNMAFRGSGYTYGGLAADKTTGNWYSGEATGTGWVATRKWSSDQLPANSLLDYSGWIDITNDPNAPSVWTVADVNELQVMNIFLENEDNDADSVNYARTTQIEVLAEFAASATPPPASGSTRISGYIHNPSQVYDNPPALIIPARAQQVTPNDLKLTFAEPLDGRCFIRDDDYFHTQSTASTSWVINHNLNSFGQIVHCYDHDNNWVFPNDIELASRNITIATFAEPVSGTAVLITYASDLNLDETTALFGDPNLGSKGFWKVGEGGDNPFFDPDKNNDINTMLVSGSLSSFTETTTAASGKLLINFEVPKNTAYTINELGVFDSNTDLHYYTRCSTLHKPDGVELHVKYRINKE